MSTINKASYPYLFGNSAIYAILAQSGITTVNTTTVNNGNYGTPAGVGITGSYNGTGTLDTTNVGNANGNLTALVNTDIPALTLTNVTYTGGPNTFTPGNRYTNAGISPSGTLTFDAQGNSNAQFFIVSSSSITFTDVSFSLINGAQADNIFWVAGSLISFTLTAGTTNTINGVLIAQSQVTFTNTIPYAVNGNIFAQTANVTFGGAGPATIYASFVCYLKGTKILTETGYVAIEHLKVGDKVATKGKIVDNQHINDDDEFNCEPIKWIGNFKAPNLNKLSFPICITAHAFEENTPFENLYVSPGHRILIDGKMVLAESLVNGTTIYQDCNRIEIEYYHLELESHSAIVANGVLAESYLDFENYSIFKNKPVVAPLQVTEGITV